MTKGEIIEFILKAIIIPIAIWGVNTMDKLNGSVAELNSKVGILIKESDRFDKAIGSLQEDQKNLSNRVLILEQKGK